MGRPGRSLSSSVHPQTMESRKQESRADIKGQKVLNVTERSKSPQSVPAGQAGSLQLNSKEPGRGRQAERRSEGLHSTFLHPEPRMSEKKQTTGRESHSLSQETGLFPASLLSTSPPDDSLPTHPE